MPLSVLLCIGAANVNKTILQNQRRSVYSINVPKYPSKAHLSLNVHPRVEDLSAAYKDFIVRANWTKVALIYSENNGASMLHLQHLLLIEDIDCLAKRIDLHDKYKVMEKHGCDVQRCTHCYYLFSDHYFTTFYV